MSLVLSLLTQALAFVHPCIEQEWIKVVCCISVVSMLYHLVFHKVEYQRKKIERLQLPNVKQLLSKNKILIIGGDLNCDVVAKMG